MCNIFFLSIWPHAYFCLLLYPTVLHNAVKGCRCRVATIWCGASLMSSHSPRRIFIIATTETVAPALAFEDCPCQHNKLTIYWSCRLERNPFRTWDLPLRSEHFISIHHIGGGEGTAGRSRRCFHATCRFLKRTSLLQPHNDLQCLRAQHANCP